MNKKKRYEGIFPSRARGAIVGLILLMISNTPSSISQQLPGGPTGREVALVNRLKISSKVLGEGSNTRPVGIFKLMNYRVEELSLSRVIKVEVKGEITETDKAWRVTITGGPFPVRALPPVIWVDDVALGYAAENEELSEITVTIFDRSLLREGTSVALSYGNDKDGRMELPEKLSLRAAR